MQMIKLTLCLLLVSLSALSARPYMAGENSGYAMNELNRTGTMLSEESGPVEMVLFPNPLSPGDALHVKINFAGSAGNMHWQLFDLKGRLLTEMHSTYDGGEYILSLPDDLREGLYLIHLRTDDEHFNRKLMIRP